MNNTVGIFYVIIMGFIFSYFLPWWTLVIPCFFVGLLTIEKGYEAFLVGFIGIFLVWTIYILYISLSNDSKLPNMVAQIFNLKSPILLGILSALIGGILGGFSCMTGSFAAKLSSKSGKN